MKKRKQIIAMLLSLAMVFGLWGSEVTVRTVMAQDVHEDAEDESYRQEVQEGAEDENQEAEKTFEDVSGEEIMGDSGEEENKEKNPSEVPKTKKAETTQLTKEDETEGSEDIKQLQEQEEVQEISEQPEEITEEQEIALLSASNLSNPRIDEENWNSTWDCVWFGNYPQAEIALSAEDYTAVDKNILKSGDIIENNSLYNKLKSASGWDINNEITIDGDKYRRMKKGDAIYTSSENGYYNWSDADTYHYFKYEPIKWWVLKVDGNEALLFSDIALDDQPYNTLREEMTWENSTIRSWLNGYGALFNKQGKDYESKNFIGSAFSSEEKSAIINTHVANYDIEADIDGGNDTMDKIFCLQWSESRKRAYGFCEYGDAADPARRCKSSTYAKAMGTWSYTGEGHKDYEDCKKNCLWWLRSPGVDPDKSDDVSYGGESFSSEYVDSCEHGVRVVLNLDLSFDLHMYAGTISSDELTMGEGNSGDNGDDKDTDDIGSAGNNGNNGNEGNGGSSGDTGNSGDSSTPDSGNNNGDAGNGGNIGNSGGNSEPNAPDLSRPLKNTPIIKKAPVKVTKITLSGISKKIAAGKKANLTASVKPFNAANKNLTWKSSNKKVATVNSKGVVTMKKKSGGKSVTITATAKDGSKVKATYKITSMEGVVKKVAVSGKKTVKAGKTLNLKAKVTATKKANKKLKWSSSNKKYATVSSSGKVKALKAGKGKKVKITAMATDGSEKKKSVTIKVK